MAKYGKWVAVAAGFMVFGASVAFAAETASPDAVADPEKVVATVGKEEIKQKDLDAVIARFDPQRAAFFSMPEGRKKLVEQLVNQRMFSLWGVESGVEKDEKFIKTLEEMKNNLIGQTALENLLDGITVTDEEIKAYYDTNKDKFAIPEQVHAFHILVASEDQAKEIRKEIEGGLAFEDAAKKYSTCPSKEQGGDLSFFGKGQMVPEFETAAFALELNKLSEPVKTEYGYHIIKIVEKKEAGTRPFDEVKDQLKETVLQEKQKKAYEAKVEELKKQFEVKIVE